MLGIELGTAGSAEKCLPLRYPAPFPSKHCIILMVVDTLVTKSAFILIHRIIFFALFSELFVKKRGLVRLG